MTKALLTVDVTLRTAPGRTLLAVFSVVMKHRDPSGRFTFITCSS